MWGCSSGNLRLVGLGKLDKVTLGFFFGLVIAGLELVRMAVGAAGESVSMRFMKGISA